LQQSPEHGDGSCAGGALVRAERWALLGHGTALPRLQRHASPLSRRHTGKSTRGQRGTADRQFAALWVLFRDPGPTQKLVHIPGRQIIYGHKTPAHQNWCCAFGPGVSEEDERPSLGAGHAMRYQLCQKGQVQKQCPHTIRNADSPAERPDRQNRRDRKRKRSDSQIH